MDLHTQSKTEGASNLAAKERRKKKRRNLSGTHSNRSSAMYSPPCSLIKFFLRSMIESVPSCPEWGYKNPRRQSSPTCFNRGNEERFYLVPLSNVAGQEPVSNWQKEINRLISREGRSPTSLMIPDVGKKAHAPAIVGECLLRKILALV